MANAVFKLTNQAPTDSNIVLAAFVLQPKDKGKGLEIQQADLANPGAVIGFDLPIGKSVLIVQTEADIAPAAGTPIEDALENGGSIAHIAMDLVLPKIDADQASALSEKLKGLKITKAGIEEKIASVTFARASISTLCMIEMKNGFKFFGNSTPVAEENFNEQIGKRNAFDDAFRQIWSHEGYLLKQRLADQAEKKN